MTFDELKSALKELKLTETRADDENLLEIVLSADEKESLNATLTQFFGKALKPAGDQPIKEVEKFTAALGGIRDNQTLYLKKEESLVRFAMIWPWSDDATLTVKISHLQEK